MTVTRSGPGSEQDVGGLGPFEPGVDGDEHRTGRGEAEQRHHPLGAVEGPDGHPVAGLDARSDQGGAERAGLLGEFGVGQPSVPSSMASAVAEPLDRRGVMAGMVAASHRGVAHRATGSATFISGPDSRP